MHRAEDIELLRRYAREQAQDAFAELVQRYLDLVYAAALRQVGGRRDLAADVAQRAFIALARHANALERHPTLVGWIYTTTRHLATSTLRSERARSHREEAYVMETTNTAPTVESEWRELRPQLDALIEQLDEVGRDAIVRRFFANQKFAEIGAALHISEDAARMRVERALERLRTLLGRNGVTSTTAALSSLLATLPAGAAAPAGLATSVTSAVATVVPLGAPSAWIAALGFTSTTKIAVVGCGVVAVISGGIYLAGQWDDSRAPSSSGNHASIATTTPAARADAHPTSQPLNATTATAQTDTAPVAPKLSAPSESPTAEAARTAGASLKSNILNRWLELANAPDFLEARTKQGYKLAQDAFAEFIEKVGLSPQDADRLAVLLTEKRLAPTNVAIAQLRNGVEPDVDSAAFRDAVVSERAKTDQEIQALLGPDRFRNFQDYAHQREEQAVLIRLQRTTGDTPDALTPDQTARLQLELRRSSDGRLSPQIIASVQPFLRPAQQQALQDALETQSEIQRQRNRDALPPRPGSP